MKARSGLAVAVLAAIVASCGGDDGLSDDLARPVVTSRPPVSATVSPSSTSPGAGAADAVPKLTVPGGAGSGATTSLPATATTTGALAAVDLRPGGPPPWSAPKITGGSARRVGLDEWGVADNRATARLVLPAEVALSSSATPRPANFSGGWAVAWDESSGPGVEPSGQFCENCGRGVAGVAGTGSAASKSFGVPFTNVVQWSDGSAVGYTGSRSDSRQFLANLFVTGQGSLYQVWSYISQRHLEYLISQLRFVEGAP